jgi:cytochrome P450
LRPGTATTIGGADTGSTVMVVVGAANRDPRRFEDPNEFASIDPTRPVPARTDDAAAAWTVFFTLATGRVTSSA